MNKLAQIIEEQASLKYDADIDVYFGEKNGYHFIYQTIENNVGQLSVSVNNGDFPNKETMKKAKNECPAISGFNLINYRVNFTIKSGISKGKIGENIKQAIDFLCEFLRRESYVSCSEISGTKENIGLYFISGSVKILSAEEFRQSSEHVMQKQEGKKLKKENIIGGITGAFLGSLIGLVVIVIISQMGYVSVLGGLIMGVCTIKGYELLSGKFTKKGILFSLIIMIAMTYVSNHLSFSLEISRYTGEGIFETFQYLYEILEINKITNIYWEELAKLFLFTAIGAVPSIFIIAKSKKYEGHAYKLGDNKTNNYTDDNLE